MKALHVIPTLNPAFGGPTYVVLNLVKALRQCGVDAEIVTTNDRGSSLLDVPLNQRIEYEQVPVWFFPRVSPPLKEYIFSVEITGWLWQHIRDYDIVATHYLFSYASTCAAAIARRQGIPYTVRTMGQLSPWALDQSRLKKQIYTFLIERHNLTHAAAIHCTSPGEVEDVRKFGIQTPTINLPLGMDLVRTPSFTSSQAKQKLYNIYGIAPETPVVLFLSRLHYKKRPDLLLQTLKTLAQENYDFHLILAGSGEPDYFTYLTNLVSSLGLAKRTSLPGFVVGEDKELLLAGSDMFVLPSFSENFGVAIAEAMSRGLPVIVTPDVQIAPEIAAFAAGLVVEGEVAALHSAIAQLLTSSTLRHQLGENGKLLVARRYSWNVIASNLTSMYTAIIQKQSLHNNLGSLEPQSSYKNYG